MKRLPCPNVQSTSAEYRVLVLSTRQVCSDTEWKVWHGMEQLSFVMITVGVMESL